MRGPALVLCCLALLAGAQALSPPWWVVATQVTTALKADKYVTAETKESGSALTINIDVAPCCTTGGRRLRAAACIKSCPAAKAKAQALATLLTRSVSRTTQNFATKVTVKVTQGNGVIKAGAAPKKGLPALAMLKNAMLGNSFFVGTGAAPMIQSPLAIFVPKVQQYYSDNISELNGLSTVVVADLMEAVFDLYSLDVLTTTSPCKTAMC